MIATVVQIGAYNGAPAFEFELKAGDRFLGADVVFLHPHAGETWDDLTRFVEQIYLPDLLSKLAEEGFNPRPVKTQRLGKDKAPALQGERPGRRHRVSVALNWVSQHGR